MERIAPLRLAGSWDNVGVLLDTWKEEIDMPATIFVTNDLTEKTLSEAVSKGASIIVTYHPTPFGKSRRLERDDPTSRVVLGCVRHGIAVYSPHTALDCAENGLNDWLARGCGEGEVKPIQPDRDNEHAGEGRVLTLAEPASVADVVDRVKAHLGLDLVRISLPTGVLPDTKTTRETAEAAARETIVRTIAVCAGSGGSVLEGAKDADLWLTGELSHHGCLAAAHRGTTVILTDHSNTERTYVLGTLVERIQEALTKDVATVIPSEVDADPLVIL